MILFICYNLYLTCRSFRWVIKGIQEDSKLTPKSFPLKASVNCFKAYLVSQSSGRILSSHGKMMKTMTLFCRVRLSGRKLYEPHSLPKNNCSSSKSSIKEVSILLLLKQKFKIFMQIVSGSLSFKMWSIDLILCNLFR